MGLIGVARWNEHELIGALLPITGTLQAPFLSHLQSCGFLIRGSEEQMADERNVPINRYVDIPCPSGKHRRSVVTFRNHTVAALFCIPCEHAWTESTDHPALRDLQLDIALGE